MDMRPWEENHTAMLSWYVRRLLTAATIAVSPMHAQADEFDAKRARLADAVVAQMRETRGETGRDGL